MNKWPEEVSRFLQRTVPIFVHLAAAPTGTAPFICRGYGFQPEPERGLLWIYILKSQWLRLTEQDEHRQTLSALLTCGMDNESYQFKGRFMSVRALTKEDVRTLEEQFRWATVHTPNLAPMIHVTPAECLSIGFSVQAVFLQTPGPGAGSLVMEGGEE